MRSFHVSIIHLLANRYVKSTVNNIKLIASIRKKKKKQKEKISLEERKYNYWIEFFMEGIKEEVEMATQYPVSSE